ncbi:MAG: helix-turn-helix transcriptional regulator [Nitrospira sp.]|nr:helix-turn-helix transcriptional regulator [Nitrospira sp.]
MPTLRHVKLKDLIQKRIDSGLSQRVLAERIGVSHGTINNILAGVRPKNIAILQALAAYFNVPVGQLFDDKDIPYVAEAERPYPDRARKLLQLAEPLDKEEIAALERCAEALASSVPGVREHLIGQMKIIERFLVHEARTSPHHKALKRTSS